MEPRRAPASQRRARCATPCALAALAGGCDCPIQRRRSPQPRAFSGAPARRRATRPARMHACMHACVLCSMHGGLVPLTPPRPSRPPPPPSALPRPAAGAVRQVLPVWQRRPAHQERHHRPGQRDAGQARGVHGAGGEQGQGPGAGRWDVGALGDVGVRSIEHACPADSRVQGLGTQALALRPHGRRPPDARRPFCFLPLPSLHALLLVRCLHLHPTHQLMRWVINNMSPRQCKWLVKIIMRDLKARAWAAACG
jgi:hypothetical protein